MTLGVVALVSAVIAWRQRRTASGSLAFQGGVEVDEPEFDR